MTAEPDPREELRDLLVQVKEAIDEGLRLLDEQLLRRDDRDVGH